MNCPDVGVWRTWIDEDLSEQAAELASHATACVSCRSTLHDLRRSSAIAGSAIGGLGSAVPSAAEVALARRRLARHQADAARPADDRPAVQPTPRQRAAGRLSFFRRWPVAIGGLAAVLVLALLVGTPMGRTAAAQFLAQFRSQRFVAIPISETGAGQHGLYQLDRLGTVTGQPGDKFTEQVKTIAEAGQRVGFPIKEPDPTTLPANVSQNREILVSRGSEMRFTFDKAKASEYFRSIGRPDVSLPDRFNGVSLVASLPAGVLLAYSGSNGNSRLVIGQSRELEVSVEGNVTLDELRDFLLGLPGLPPELVRQLRGIRDWRTTLPIPVPIDEVSWQETTIGGGQGLLLNDNSGIGSAAIWQRDGRVYGIAGTLKAAEIRRIADSLR